MVDYYQQVLNNRPADQDGRDSFWAVIRTLASIGLVLAAVLTYAWIQVETLDLSYREEQTIRQNRSLRELVSQLKVEHSSLTAPDLIDRAARDQGYVRYDEGIQVVDGQPSLFRPGEVLMAKNDYPTAIAD